MAHAQYHDGVQYERPRNGRAPATLHGDVWTLVFVCMLDDCGDDEDRSWATHQEASDGHRSASAYAMRSVIMVCKSWKV
jgi:hypothetical protein